jgi:hypothetical protein
VSHVKASVTIPPGVGRSFLRFVLGQGDERKAADREAVVTLAQVASSIKVAHAGLRGPSNHRRGLQPPGRSCGPCGRPSPGSSGWGCDEGG